MKWMSIEKYDVPADGISLFIRTKLDSGIKFYIGYRYGNDWIDDTECTIIRDKVTHFAIPDAVHL